MGRAWEWWAVWLWSPVVLAAPVLLFITAAGALLEWVFPRRDPVADEAPCAPRSDRMPR